MSFIGGFCLNSECVLYQRFYILTATEGLAPDAGGSGDGSDRLSDCSHCPPTGQRQTLSHCSSQQTKPRIHKKCESSWLRERAFSIH